MRRALWLTALIVVCSAARAASAQEIGWQEAVARLAQERTLAETCVALLKKHGNAGAINRGRLGNDRFSPSGTDGSKSAFLQRRVSANLTRSIRSVRWRLARARQATHPDVEGHEP